MGWGSGVQIPKRKCEGCGKMRELGGDNLCYSCWLKRKKKKPEV